MRGKMFKKMKTHWFSILLTSLIVLYLIFLSLIFFAPREDELNRGFIPCTQNLIKEINACPNHGIWCTAKIVLKNNACDFNVVREGFVLWLNGRQPKPWSNYFFEPVSNLHNDQTWKDYYDEHENIVRHMEDLNKERIELEKNLAHIKEEVPETPVQTKENIKDDK